MNTENIYTTPERQPASEVPSLVDSLTLTIKAMAERGIAIPGQLRNMVEVWGPATGGIDVKDYGVEVIRVPADSKVPSCEPGSNRVSLFDDLMPRSYLEDLLREFNSPIGFPLGFTYMELESERRDIEPPFVLKDTAQQRGRGKLLVVDEKAKKKLLSYLKTKKKKDKATLVVEQYIETPTDRNTSYRLIATPDGGIDFATLLYSEDYSSQGYVGPNDVGVLLAPLASKNSRHFIGSPAITSNTGDNREVIGLTHADLALGSFYELARLSDTDQGILDSHQISSKTREAPDSIIRAGFAVARIIGASIGVSLGIDLIQGRDDGILYLLEVNSQPQYTAINNSVAQVERVIDDPSMRRGHFLRVLESLGNGRFSNNPF
ncbi:hypothetical protein H6792_03595 [Candidatus Nomurabacteria bacterium]|nr:hypothetical protein [Candidatus Nomurabacteria bacterium]